MLHQTQLETSAALLQLVAEFAHQHHAGTVDPIKAQLPGRERAVRLGGEGTPLVAEFAPAMLAARIGLSPYAGGRGASQSSSRPGHSTNVEQSIRPPSRVSTLGPAASTATTWSLIQVHPSGITLAAGRSSDATVASPAPT